MIARRARRAWYFVRSFFRHPWTLDDYPVDVRRQDPPDDAPTDRRERTWHEYLARIDGMVLVGLGDTPEAARAELAERFENYRSAHEALPRPGTIAPIQFASTARLDAHGPLRDEFVERILHMVPAQVFVSDESGLSQFPDGAAEYSRRIMLLYGIDVDELADDRFPTILDAIAARPARGGRV